MRVLKRWNAVYCLAVLGCEPPLRELTLDKVPSPGIQVQVFSKPFHELNIQGVVLQSDDSKGCLSFHGTATMDGTPLVQETPGDVRSDSASVTSYCFPPNWALPTTLPDEPVTTFALSDASSSISGAFRSLGATRSVAFHPPTTGSLHWGQLVALDWSPATDQIAPRNIGVTFVAGVSLPIAGPQPVGSLDAGTYDAGLIAFLMPSTAPPGDGGWVGQLEVSIEDGISPALETCSAGVTCQADVSPFFGALDASVTP
jgi:hypothetical protein